MTDRQRIKRLWRDYLWPQKGRLFLAAIFMALFAAATAGYVYLIQLVIDAISALEADGGAIENAKHYAAIIVPSILGLTLAAGIGGYVQRILTNSIALNTVGKMQTQMLRAAHARDYAQSEAEATGELIAKFTNCLLYTSDAADE